MTYVDRETIQLGWSVWTSDGQELGKVVAVEPHEIRVKKGGLLGGEISIPEDAVREVEEHRVELSLTKAEVESAKH